MVTAVQHSKKTPSFLILYSQLVKKAAAGSKIRWRVGVSRVLMFSNYAIIGTTERSFTSMEDIYHQGRQLRPTSTSATK